MGEAERIADALEDYQWRLLRGDTPRPEDYADALGESYPEFLKAVEGHAALGALLEPLASQSLPRAFGHYLLLREVGRGTAGVVYEAKHRELGRRQAVKVLRPGFDAEALERFRREARACAQVKHPGVVEIYETGTIEQEHYYAMTLVEGPTLSALVAEGGLPPPRELCARLAGVADALQAIHDAGVVHRDVKPSNIVVATDGRFVLADFGLARLDTADSVTLSHQTLGTPRYMSPEQVRGRRHAVDQRTDIYSLGATAYEALTRRPVFEGDQFLVLYDQILHRRPDAPSRMAKGLPRECDAVVLKALEKRPGDRYPTASAMRADLEAIAEGLEPAGRPVSLARRAARKAREHAIGIAAVVLVALAGTFWLATRPAVLMLTAYPVARVRVNGVDRGPSPVRVEIAAGPTVVRLERERFRPMEVRMDLPAGKTELHLALVPSDPGDPNALDELREALGVPPAGATLDTQRSPGDAVAVAVFPAGRVRKRDLATLRFEVLEPRKFPAEGVIEFRRADEVLHREPFAPTKVVTEAAFPAAVRDAVEPGDRVTWGLRSWSATFEVVADDPRLAAQLARFEKVLKDHAPATRSYLTGLLLLEHDLPLAAFLRVREDDGVPALGVTLEALRRLDLGESQLTLDSLQRAGDLAPSVRERWFR